MPAYRPAGSEPLTLSLGSWTSTGRPSLAAFIQVDPRAFAWLVNRAAARAAGVYEVKLGDPPLKLTVEET